MSAKTSSRPDDPDTVILLAAANRVLTDRLLAAMDAAGLQMRPAWGYVIRALYARPLPLARLAELLDVTKQAAQQTVDDMQAAGLVARQEDPDDRRRKLLALTAEGRRVRATALEVGAQLEREMGPTATRALRTALLGMVERHGDLEHVLARRSRALW
jgi:DNA-binding MarR family transcriptional regulator